MKLIWLLLLPSSLGVPLTNFFPFNRTGTICRASRTGDDVTERLNDGSCEAVLFPSGIIEGELIYNTAASVPFFNETITTITVRILMI